MSREVVTAAPAAEPEDRTPTAYRILCRQPGFRRGGRAWPAETHLPAVDLSQDLAVALLADAEIFTVVPVFGDEVVGPSPFGPAG